jgi:hypothetical protein
MTASRRDVINTLSCPHRNRESHMSTRVSASARISAACRELVNQRLNITLGAAVDLGQVQSALDSGRVDLPALQGMMAGEISGVLSALAPAPFARARDILAGPGLAADNPSVLMLSARTELVSALTVARSAIAGATRDVTADAFAEAGRDLRYTVSLCRGASATGIELRRANEIMLLRIHDGGVIESDHAGLVDNTCADRQRELEEAVARRGIVLTGRKQLNHGAYNGGDLITAAASVGDPSLARATVTHAEQAATRPRDRGIFAAADETEAVHRSRVRRGGAA